MTARKKAIITRYYSYLTIYRLPKSNKFTKRTKLNKKTNNQQKKLNNRNAQIKLMSLIANNFSKKDLFITLTYDDKHYVKKDIEKNLKNLLKTLRRLYKKYNLILKYICITESIESRYHHHLLLSNIPPNIFPELTKKWGCGYMDIRHFNGAIEDIERISKYFLKKNKTDNLLKDLNPFSKECERNYYAHRWLESKNLIKPTIEIEDYIAFPKSISYDKNKFNIRNPYDGTDHEGYRYISYQLIPIKLNKSS